MSEILGHDVNGRPLRAGDRVFRVGKAAGFCPPQPWTVAGPAPNRPGGLAMVELDLDGDEFGSMPAFLRRADDCTDHQPSEYTYDELLDSLKTGAPNHAKA